MSRVTAKQNSLGISALEAKVDSLMERLDAVLSSNPVVEAEVAPSVPAELSLFATSPSVATVSANPLASIQSPAKKVHALDGWAPDQVKVGQLIQGAIANRTLIHFGTVCKELGIPGSAWHFQQKKIFKAFDAAMPGASACLIGSSNEYGKKVREKHNAWVTANMQGGPIAVI